MTSLRMKMMVIRPPATMTEGKVQGLGSASEAVRAGQGSRCVERGGGRRCCGAAAALRAAHGRAGLPCIKAALFVKSKIEWNGAPEGSSSHAQ